MTVRERESERIRKLGFSAGVIRVYPTSSVRLAYDSNVFAARDPEGDAVVTLAGAVVAEQNSSRFSSRLSADVSRALYKRFTSENATQWRTAGDATFLLPAEFKLKGAASYERRVEPRTSSGAPLTAGRPVQYSVATADGEISWQGARTSVAIGGRVAKFDYRDSAVAGVRLDQQARDFTYALIRARLGYDLSGERQFFLEGDRHWVNYRLPQPVTNANRDSAGWQVRAGLSSSITPLIRGTVSLGYLRESFRVASARPVSSLAFNASLDWLASPITTVHLDATRQMENSASIDSAGYLASHLLLRVDHELTRDWVFDLTATYDDAAFRSIDRRDKVRGLTFGARRQLTRGLSAKADVGHQSRASSGADRGFNFHKFIGSVGLGYNF